MLNLVFLKNSWAISNEWMFIWKLEGEWEWKFIQKSYMANMAAMLIYVKNLGRFETKVHVKV